MQSKKQGFFENESSLIFMVFATPLETWANWVYEWCVDTGRIGTIETLEGLKTENTNLEKLPINYLYKILEELAKTKKAELFQVSGEWAVKFFHN